MDLLNNVVLQARDDDDDDDDGLLGESFGNSLDE